WGHGSRVALRLPGMSAVGRLERARYSALFAAAFLDALGAPFFSTFGLSAFFALGFTSFGAASLSSGLAAFFAAFLKRPPPPPLATRAGIRPIACASRT